MIRPLRVLCAALLVVFAGACAASEYTANSAEVDLARLGFTTTQAKCVLDGLHDRYANEYVKLNNFKKVDRVNPDAVALYVRNVFASQARIGNDEVADARGIVARCKK